MVAGDALLLAALTAFAPRATSAPVGRPTAIGSLAGNVISIAASSFLSRSRLSFCLPRLLMAHLFPGCAAGSIEELVDLGRQDEIVLMQPCDLLCPQRNRHVPPAEGDIGVVTFAFG